LNEREVRIWEEAVMACFAVLSWQLTGETEENPEKPQDWLHFL
jgi:hypothetical protein